MRSVPDPGFDQRIADWLEEDPDSAPAAVLETVAAAIPSISQRRHWRQTWRSHRMLRLAVVASTMVFIASFAAFLFTGGSFGPTVVPTSPPPTVAPSPSPVAIATFTSPRHGYTISYPNDWTVRPATAPWPIGVQAAGFSDPMVDLFKDPAAPSYDEFDIVSQPLGEIINPTAWLEAYEVSNPGMPPDCWPAPDAMEKITIDSQPAYVHGGSECGFTEAVVFDGGRVYEFSAYSQPGGPPMMSRTVFDQLMASVKLDPASADDSPPAVAVGSPAATAAPSLVASLAPLSIEEFRAQRDTICDAARAVAEPLRTRFLSYGESHTDAQLSDWADAFDQFANEYDAMIPQLSALKAPAFMGSSPALNVLDYQIEAALIRRAALEIRDNHVAAAQIDDTATNAPAQRISSFEGQYVLHDCP
jgi:hypothetical protein